MTAVILAGGKGTRLYPYTISLPKPLMPVGEHPIMEILIRQLKKNGVVKIIIAVGYLESLIRAYFGDGSKFGVNIVYSSEEISLGTAGPLYLLKDELKDTFFFMNGDILSNLDFDRLLEFHRKNKAFATVGLTKRKIDIDFGVIEINEFNEFQKWQEKPTINYLVSMGAYVLEPEILNFLPDCFINIPDLMIKMINEGKKVVCYIHDGFWLDIGRISDYQDACRLIGENGKEFL